MKIIEVKDNVIDILDYVVSEMEGYQKLEAIPDYDFDAFCHLYLQRSGGKTISTFFEYVLGDNTIVLPNNYIAKSIKTMYSRKWDKLLDTYSIEYNAIKPYNMALEDELKRDHLQSTSSRSGGGTSDSTDKGSYQGFNSTEFTDTDKQVSNARTTNHSSDNYTRDRDSKREIIRTGNIGNKSSQQLIEEEREMLKWNVYITIFKDIDKILCARVWDTEIK